VASPCCKSGSVFPSVASVSVWGYQYWHFG